MEHGAFALAGLAQHSSSLSVFVGLALNKRFHFKLVTTFLIRCKEIQVLNRLHSCEDRSRGLNNRELFYIE